MYRQLLAIAVADSDSPIWPETSRVRKPLSVNCRKNDRPGIWTGDETAAGVYYVAWNRIRIAFDNAPRAYVTRVRSLPIIASRALDLSRTAAKNDVCPPYIHAYHLPFPPSRAPSPPLSLSLSLSAVRYRSRAGWFRPDFLQITY